MAKGYILVDVPEKCKMCRFYYPSRDMHTGEYASECKMITTMMIREPEKRPDWCPIRELPEKMEVCGKYPQPGKPMPSYRIGWNACLAYLEEKNVK